MPFVANPTTPTARACEYDTKAEGFREIEELMGERSELIQYRHEYMKRMQFGAALIDYQGNTMLARFILLF